MPTATAAAMIIAMISIPIFLKAVYDGDNENYSVYDDSGKFLRTAEDNRNSYDDAPNLLFLFKNFFLHRKNFGIQICFFVGIA